MPNLKFALFIASVFCVAAPSQVFASLADRKNCDQVMNACLAAGYLRGEKVLEGKHAGADCFFKLIEQKPVAGIQLGKGSLQKQLDACRTYRNDRATQMAARKAARKAARAKARLQK